MGELDAGSAVTPPRFVIFEGVDGAGKTTFARALKDYYRTRFPAISLHYDSFPGHRPGTLGEWVYRLHHHAVEKLSPDDIEWPALQLLHVAAHVDIILSQIQPQFRQGGSVILDRYWWSTYAYSRRTLPADQVWQMVAAERTFWRAAPQPVAIYLRRGAVLAESTLAAQTDRYYAEVIASERYSGAQVLEIANDAPVDVVWERLLHELNLPIHPFPRSATLPAAEATPRMPLEAGA
jgi:thymidylate kinase